MPARTMMKISARTATKAVWATKKLPRRRAAGRVVKGVRVRGMSMEEWGGEGPAWRWRKGSRIALSNAD
jgi:hypothetical protein